MSKLLNPAAQVPGLRKTGICWVHGHHKPDPLVHVFHHIVPREWQRKWNPRGVRYARYQNPPLWAPDCVSVCPTGHANIHVHINRLLVQLRLAHRMDSAYWMDVIKHYRPPHVNRNELKVAKQAFYNYNAAGGAWLKILEN